MKNRSAVKTILWGRHICRLVKAYYSAQFGKNICLDLVETRTSDPVAIATTFIEGLEADELAIKDYHENAGMLSVLISSGVVSPPHRMHNGFPIVRLLIAIE